MLDNNSLLLQSWYRILSAKDNTRLRELRHPNILQFLGSIVQQEEMVLITEYLPKVHCAMSQSYVLIRLLLVVLFHLTYLENFIYAFKFSKKNLKKCDLYWTIKLRMKWKAVFCDFWFLFLPVSTVQVIYAQVSTS